MIFFSSTPNNIIVKIKYENKNAYAEALKFKKEINKNKINDFLYPNVLKAYKYNGNKGTKNFPRCPLSIDVAPKLGIIDSDHPAGLKEP